HGALKARSITTASATLFFVSIRLLFRFRIGFRRGGPGGLELQQAGSIFVGRVWFVVPDPPLIRRSLGIALRRVLPLLLAPERSDVEVVPGAPHLLVAAIVDEVGSEHAVASSAERVGAVPFIHADVRVDSVPTRV